MPPDAFDEHQFHLHPGPFHARGLFGRDVRKPNRAAGSDPFGPSLFDNHERTVTDFTADAVRVKVRDDWVKISFGRQF